MTIEEQIAGALKEAGIDPATHFKGKELHARIMSFVGGGGNTLLLVQRYVDSAGKHMSDAAIPGAPEHQRPNVWWFHKGAYETARQISDAIKASK